MVACSEDESVGSRLGVYGRLSRRHRWTAYAGDKVLSGAGDSVYDFIRRQDPTQGERSLVLGDLLSEGFPGDHTGLLETPDGAVLAKIMNTRLANSRIVPSVVGGAI